LLNSHAGVDMARKKPNQGPGGPREWFEPDTGRPGADGGPEDDNVGGRPGSEHDSRGRRGVRGRRGGSASFEVESEDYARSMGHQDRGRMSEGRSERDDDFTALGRRSRFGDQGDRGSDPAGENRGRHPGARRRDRE
jgi:hypothetical protein